MRRSDGVALGGLALALALVGWSMSEEKKFSEATGLVIGPDRDWNKLQPAFAQRLRRVFAVLATQGWRPVLNEGFRSEERARRLAAQGAGVEQSMHCYGLAADVRDAVHGYNEKKFFDALGVAAQRQGLVWGGAWKRNDSTHVQAVPVTMQEAIRADGERVGPVAAGANALARLWGRA